MPIEINNPPKDHLQTAFWTITIDNKEYITIDSVTLPTRAMGTQTRGHGGTGMQFTFPNHMVTFSAWRFTKVWEMDNGRIVEDDFYDLITDSIKNGTKHSVHVVKYDHGDPVFTIFMKGVLFIGEDMPSLGKDSTAIFRTTVSCTADWWERINN